MVDGSGPLFPKPFKPRYDEAVIEQVLDTTSLEERIVASEDGEEYVERLDQISLPVDFQANLDDPLRPRPVLGERVPPVLMGLVIGAVALVVAAMLL